MKKTNAGYLLILIIVGAIAFASGFFVGESQKVFIDPSGEMDLSLLYETYYLLEEKFPEFKEVEEETLVHGTIKGLIGALEDPHTSFFDKEESKIFMEDVAGEFEGVGMEIGIRDRGLQVISPLKNPPAYKAGIKSQDVITKIDGEDTEGISIQEAVAKIRGPKGESVALEIMRNGEKKEIEIIRDTIEIPSIEWEILEKDIAHLELFHFNENIVVDFTKVSREIVNSPAEKIILDLRNNPGGTFRAAIGVASRFVESGSVVVIKTGTDDKQMSRLKTTTTPPYLLEYPVVVLINEGTASASEIVAGALRDHREIPIVGKNSFGKGSIQGLHSLSDRSTLKITEEYFLTPDEQIIEEKGIAPDFEIDITEEDVEKDRDPQLEKAIEIISNK